MSSPLPPKSKLCRELNQIFHLLYLLRWADGVPDKGLEVSIDTQDSRIWEFFAEPSLQNKLIALLLRQFMHLDH